MAGPGDTWRFSNPLADPWLPGIFSYMNGSLFMVNVGKYTIHSWILWGWDILGDSSNWCFFFWLFNRDPYNFTKSTHNWAVVSPLYTKELDSEFVS